MKSGTGENSLDTIPSITKREVEDAIRSLSDGKSPGYDNISAEFLKTEGATVDILHKICNLIWTTGIWPSHWTKSIIVPLPKNGDIQECNNYRTISLNNHPSKVLLQILLTRLRSQIEEILKEEQAGFRKGRSTTEQLFNVRVLCEKYREHGREIHHNFIDFKKKRSTVFGMKLCGARCGRITFIPT